MKVHGWSFPDTRMTFQERKVVDGGGGGMVTCRNIVSAQVPVPVPFLQTLELKLELSAWTSA